MADIKKLKAAGICTIKGVQMTTRRRMCQIKGFSEAKVDKIKEACTKVSGENCFLTAAQVIFFIYIKLTRTDSYLRPTL